jgi:hypothetical protein
VRRDLVYGRLRKQRCGLHASAAAVRVLSDGASATSRCFRTSPTRSTWAVEER